MTHSRPALTMNVQKLNMRLLAFTLICLFSVKSFCQNPILKFIPADSAITIANKYGRFNSEKNKQQGWTTNQPQIDTVNAIWKITSIKMVRFQNWGKTTKNFQTDFRRSCRRVNGCRVYRTKTISIDANTGRVINVSKNKQIFGNYE